MTVRLYKSTDASAPTLNGTSGALCTVLDAVLVNGYGSQTAAGWTTAYTGTNKRQYAMASGGTSCQLYIDDSAPGAGGAKEARINGFKTGTALGTGTGQFPTTSQQTAPSGALVVRKSTTADSTARAWTIIADGHTLYMFVETGDQTAPLMSYPWAFGDFFTYSSSDTYNCQIIGRTNENTGGGGNNTTASEANTYDAFGRLTASGTSGLSTTLSGHYAAANYTGVGGSLPFGKHSDGHKMGASNCAYGMGYLGNALVNTVTGSQWTTEFNYPNPADSGLWTAPVFIHHGGMVRGYMKGLWCPLQHMPLGHGDTYTGTGNLAGKSFIAMNVLGTLGWNTSVSIAYTPYQAHIEYSDTWS